MYIDAVKLGMSKHDFYHSTIKDVNIFIYAYNKREEERIRMDEYRAWLNGMYVMSAIGSAFSKDYQYPENPLTRKDVQSIAERTGMSEEELNNKLFIAQLMVKESNLKIQSILDSQREQDGED